MSCQMYFWKVSINVRLSLSFLHILKSKPWLVSTSELLVLFVINTEIGTAKTSEILLP